MKIHILFCVCVLLIGCGDNVKTTTEAIWIHNASQQVVQLKFTSGLPLALGLDTVISLNIDENKHIFSTGEITGGPIGVTIQNIIHADTCLIIFNDSVFLRYDLYEVNDERNILKIHTYNKDVNERKNLASYKYTYIITEQDFLNAEPL